MSVSRSSLARRSRAHIAGGFTREAMCARTIWSYEKLLFPEARAVKYRPKAGDLGANPLVQPPGHYIYL